MAIEFDPPDEDGVISIELESPVDVESVILAPEMVVEGQTHVSLVFKDAEQYNRFFRSMMGLPSPRIYLER